MEHHCHDQEEADGRPCCHRTECLAVVLLEVATQDQARFEFLDLSISCSLDSEYPLARYDPVGRMSHEIFKPRSVLNQCFYFDIGRLEKLCPIGR